MASQRDLRLAAGQTLIMGFEGTTTSAELREMLREIQPAGVILFARNIEDSGQTHALLGECRSLVQTPMFLCVDMEGGTVDRLKKAIAPATSAAAVFASGNKKLFRKHGELIGRECRAAGFNTDFAPVFDLAFAASQGVLGSRAVSADPEKVTTYVGEFLRGLRSAGVLGCGKHFPGLGEAELDSHHVLPSIHKPWKKLWKEDLYPYRRLLNQLPFIVVTHAAYPEISGEGRPASLSHYWMTTVLRNKIGYRGLIATDDLEMGAILAAGSVADAACESLRAGADIALVCHRAENVSAAFASILRAAEEDTGFRKRMGEASRRILALKRRHAELKRFSPRPTAETISRLRGEIEKFSGSVEA